MKIAFACPNCARQLSADAALAGRTGRCRHCGQRLVVPDARRAGGVQRSAAEQGAKAAKRPVLPDWQTAVASQLKPKAGHGSAASDRSLAASTASLASGYSLRPVTPSATPALELPDWGSGELGDPIDLPVPVPVPAFAPPIPRTPQRHGPKEPSPAVLAYRWIFSRLVWLSNWISETSYTVSFILIILSIASGMAGRHSLAALGTAAIVVLNLIGLVGDVVTLVTLSFRRNPVQGTLFLVPPFTIYYLWSDWDRYRSTVGRMRIPLVTLAVVVAAYLFVPWLRGGVNGEGPLVASVKRVIGTVEKDLGRPKGGVEEWLKKARAGLREVPLPHPSSLPGAAHDTGRRAHEHGP